MSLFEEIKESVIKMETDRAVELTKRALAEGNEALRIVNEGLIAGIEVVGEKFKNFEYFLPEVITAAKAFRAGFEVVMPELKESGYKPKGCVLMGTVEGDNHDIGKNIVMALLQGNGYETHDAGVDVSPMKFVELVKELKPNIVGMSALLTTTMPKMKETVGALGDAGLRDSVKVIIGGSCVSAEYANTVGADGYGDDATDAVKLVDRLMSGA
ncbi:MAG: corrinoid protein [bacterium]